jgi:molybdopterin-guanine dinucleotide biosynthesis protein A
MTATDPPTRVAAIVLAGGRGSRLGGDKPAADVGGRALLARVIEAASEVADELIVVAAPGQPPALRDGMQARVVYDSEAYAGPLPGIVAGLAAASAPAVLLLPCDHPFLEPGLLRTLLAQLAVAPAVLPVYEGRPQPLPSAVRGDQRERLAALAAAGGRAASALADLPGALLLAEPGWRPADPQGRSFIGVNTAGELARAREIAAGDERGT